MSLIMPFPNTSFTALKREQRHKQQLVDQITILLHTVPLLDPSFLIQKRNELIREIAGIIEVLFEIHGYM